jgi:hypothetical protein
MSGNFLFASVDIGTKIFTKTFFNSKSVEDNSLDKISNSKDDTLQRVQFYLKGNIHPNIEAKIQLQGIGTWNSTDSIKIDGNSYQNFEPFVEQAYLKISDIFGINKNSIIEGKNDQLKDKKESKKSLQIDLTIGRQKIFYGDGFILSDNNLGLFGYKLELLSNKFDIDILSMKKSEKADENFNIYEQNTDLYAGVIKLNKLLKNESEENQEKLYPYLYYVTEQTEIKDQNIKDTRNFLGIRIDGISNKKIFYKAELAKQTGTYKDFTNKDNTKDYDGLFYIVGLKYKINDNFLKENLLKNIFFKANYLKTTGKNENDNDETISIKNENFNSKFTNQVFEDGNIYFGEIYSRLYPSLENKEISNFGLEFNELFKTTLCLDYFSFKSEKQEYELDIALKYKLNNFISSRIYFAMYNKMFADPKLSTETKKDDININQAGIEFSYSF